MLVKVLSVNAYYSFNIHDVPIALLIKFTFKQLLTNNLPFNTVFVFPPLLNALLTHQTCQHLLVLNTAQNTHNTFFLSIFT